MFFEFASRLVSLDIAWIISLVMDNLIWVFLFYALIYIFMEGKRAWAGFLVIVASMWLWSDFGGVTGTGLFVGAFLLLYYLSKLAVMAWAENSPGLSKNLFWVSEVQALLAVLIYVIFLSG